MRAGTETLHEHWSRQRRILLQTLKGRPLGSMVPKGGLAPGKRFVHTLWMSWEQGSWKRRRPPVQEHVCHSFPGVFSPKQAPKEGDCVSEETRGMFNCFLMYQHLLSLV